ncbi:MAG: CBS domain-containing protein [Desulfobacterales bacterium]|nr:CBS domain-containing protein [Desulfobacterales bacterium]
MPVVETASVFSGIPVSTAMRRQVISLPATADIGQGIRLLIRYKANAVLLTDNDIPHGVVSKTDLLGAYYGEIPTEMALGDVMGSQPIACFPDDLVEDALEIMEAAGVHRLYVTGANREEVVGTLSYADIVGLLYRYCRTCERGTAQKRLKRSGGDPASRLRVKDVMTPEVWACRDSDPLFTVIETLTSQQMGAVLIQDEARSSIGVISKTDLIIAYHHGIAPQTAAGEIMSTPIHAVQAGELLSTAIQQMLVSDVQRLFVHHDTSHQDPITGVLALSDAARFRSGSCRACTAGRLLVR